MGILERRSHRGIGQRGEVGGYSGVGGRFGSGGGVGSVAKFAGSVAKCSSTIAFATTLLLARRPSRLLVIAAAADDVKCDDERAPKSESCNNPFQLVKVKNWVDGQEGGIYDGVTARFGSLLPENVENSVKSPAIFSNPIDYRSTSVSKGYVVLNKPWAFVQWLEKTTIEEEYMLMAEPDDYIFIRPLPNLADGGHLVIFPFFLH